MCALLLSPSAPCTAQERSHSRLALTAEAQIYVDCGATPEARVFEAAPASSAAAPLAQLQGAFDKAVWAVGFKKAMERGWIRLEKVGGRPLVSRAQDGPVEDACLAQLRGVASGAGEPGAGAVAELKKRKLVRVEQWKTYRLTRARAFARERVKPATDLTAEMLRSGEWRTRAFKEYNFEARRGRLALFLFARRRRRLPASRRPLTPARPRLCCLARGAEQYGCAI